MFGIRPVFAHQIENQVLPEAVYQFSLWELDLVEEVTSICVLPVFPLRPDAFPEEHEAVNLDFSPLLFEVQFDSSLICLT